MVNSVKIDAKEVLLYLNQLGYTNISAQTLKEFLTDLKKLIKSLAQISNSDILLNDYSSIRNDTIWKTPPTHHESKTKNQLKSFDKCVKQYKDDISSKKMRHISLHLLRNTNQIHHRHCVHEEEIINTDGKSKNSENKSAVDCATVESASKTTVPTSKGSQSSSTVKKHLGSGKTVRILNRKDPVALYHYYQSEWKKVKFPGEEEHAILRRTIRKKLSDTNFKKT